MIVVSDTSPITSLLVIHRLTILEQLFSTVLIPPAVEAELKAYHADLPPFIEVHELTDPEQALTLEESLDRGEAEAIVLAAETHADLILMDERTGRSIASQRGLHVIGLAGVLVLAKRRGLIGSVDEVLHELESDAGFYLSAEVRRLALGHAGEDQHGPVS